MTAPPQLEWVKKPRQLRSQETLERILEAAEELLLEKRFEAIAVSEIAKRARSSVGAFYARFSDKEALLRCVFERFYAQALATAEHALDPGRWDGVGAQEFLEASTRFLIRVFREREHFVAALAHRAGADEELAAMGERLGQVIAERLRALLSRRGERVGHRDPDTAVRVSVWLIMSALESRAAFAPSPPVSEGALASEIAAMCRSYLQIEARAGAPRAAAHAG